MIRLFPGVSDISYYREPSGKQEIDFVVRVGSRVVPIEIVYKNQTDSHHRDSVRTFLETHGKQNSFGILVTKKIGKSNNQFLKYPCRFFC